jgi:hypothetical protein
LADRLREDGPTGAQQRTLLVLLLFIIQFLGLVIGGTVANRSLSLAFAACTVRLLLDRFEFQIIRLQVLVGASHGVSRQITAAEASVRAASTEGSSVWQLSAASSWLAHAQRPAAAVQQQHVH